MRKVIYSTLLLMSGFFNLDAQTSWVNRIGTEWTSVGDFDKDGFADVLEVQASRGTYHILYGDPEGGQLSPQRMLGTTDVTGLSVGKFKSLTHDRFIIASPSANQLFWFDDASRLSATVIHNQEVAGIGPSQVVCLPEIEPSLTDHHDLFLLTSLNNDGPQIERIDGNDASALYAAKDADTLKEGNAVRFSDYDEELIPVFIRVNDLGVESLWAGNPNRSTLDTLLDEPFTGTGYQFTASVIPPVDLTRFIVWQVGSKQFRIYNLLEKELPEEGYYFDGSFTHTFEGKGIQSVILLDNDPCLFLFIFDGQFPAELYEFDGEDLLTFRHSFPPPSGGEIRGAAALGNGVFTLSTASDVAGPTDQIDLFPYDEVGYNKITSHILDSSLNGGGANVFVYDQEPFVGEGSLRRFVAQAPDWSVDVSMIGDVLTASREIDSGPDSGLKQVASTDVGTWDEGGFTVYNQWLPDLSLVSLSQNIGEEFVSISVSPDPGYYEQAISVQFTVSPAGSDIFYRERPDGTWKNGNEPFYSAEDVTYELFAETADGRKGPIQQVSYDFPSPDAMDSDQDGIPDYVELAKGIDPFGGSDSDGDGWSDLDELHLSTSPNDENDFPSRDSSRLSQETLVDLRVTPHAYVPGEMISEVVVVSGMPLRLSGPVGQLVESVETRIHGVAGVDDPSAHFEDIPMSSRFPWLTVSTPGNFSVQNNVVKLVEKEINGELVQTWTLDGQTGRQLLGFIRQPDLPPRGTPDYQHQGGSAQTEADAWIAAAVAFYQAEEAIQVSMDLEVMDTLVALIFERGIGLKLLSRGLVETSNISLFPFREGDVGLLTPSLEDIQSLAYPESPGVSAYSAEVYLAWLEDKIETGGGKTDDLIQLAAGIYRISADFGDDNPDLYPPPVTTLRNYIQTGTLPLSYEQKLGMDPVSIASATAALQSLLNGFSARPHVTGLTLYPMSSVNHDTGCTIFEDLNEDPVALIDQLGRPFPMPLSFQLTPDMEFRVSGYTDVHSDCAETTLEVTSFILSSVAQMSPSDTNGNLLPDAVEQSLQLNGEDYLDDADEDGYSNLQEILEGTDPTDEFSVPATVVADLRLPELELKTDLQMSVEWTWPASYQKFVTFELVETENLNSDFQVKPLSVQVEGDTMRMNLPNAGDDNMKFYRLGISLK
ncbi:hypothetical protein P0Y35_03830 [Kiritimatiellaeota bacterium B1221]|nr:hypothetical protein [Kiritimatiellaeota bacterium B1221]